jgi:hypothetical protein
MPVPIVLSGLVSSWAILWACFGIGAAAVVVLTTVLAIVTAPRHARHRRPAAARAQESTPAAEAREHAHA